MLLIAAAVVSCSDDFLSKNNDNLYLLTDTLFINYNQDNVETVITSSGKHQFGLLDVYAAQMAIIQLTARKGNFRGHIPGISASGRTIFTGVIRFITPVLSWTSKTTVWYHLWQPMLISGHQLYNVPKVLLTFFQTPVSFTIRNSSEGILLWKITGVPDWLDSHYFRFFDQR